MTTVYVVFHNDIEDSKWVRGVFSTRELAQARADSPEPDSRGSGWTNDHFTRGGTVPSICCEVDEWTLDA